MVNSKEIRQIAKRLFKGKKQLKDRQLMHPNREWFIGIVVAVLIFGVSAAWSAQTYLEYQDVNIEVGLDTQQSEVAYRDAQVKAALELYENKAERLQALLNNAPLPAPEPTPEPEVATSTNESTESPADVATTTDTIATTSPEEE